MNDEISAIGIDDSFTFSCSGEVPCFNECCRDLNQFLTPYDILCLKNGLAVPSGKFLETYTLQHTGPGTGLPVVTVPMGYTHGSLPAGLQILGRPYSEGLLFGLAYAYEQATRHRVPPGDYPELDP